VVTLGVESKLRRRPTSAILPEVHFIRLKMPNKPASPTPNCGGRFARRRSFARAAVDVMFQMLRAGIPNEETGIANKSIKCYF
jgi:hypothetical protein